MFVIGLMSGTSADGVDAALLRLAGQPPVLDWQLLHHAYTPYPAALRQAVLHACHPDLSSSEKLCALNFELGNVYADAVLVVCNAAGIPPDQVDLIGSHGQTVWHEPAKSTLQLGEPAIIAERTGITTLSAFRQRDMAAGGQGAPLVAYIDQLLFSHATITRVCQNIGGIANLTWLPARSSAEPQPVLAFDSGPGNSLLDYAAQFLTDGELDYDRDGLMAAAGHVNRALLNRWLAAEPYFQMVPPKSTGRERFSHAYMLHLLESARQAGLSDDNFMAALTAFTSQSIIQACRQFLPCMPQQIILSGGGAENPVLVSQLASGLPDIDIQRSDALGLPSAAKEAVAFAVLAYESWHNRPGNLPSATGAGKPVVLGSITPGSNYRHLIQTTFCI